MKIQEIKKRITGFAEEIWDNDLYSLPKTKRKLFALCRVIAIVTKGFIEDRCAQKAAALTYITLISMVPVLALMLSVAKGMGAQNKIMEIIGLEQVTPIEASADYRYQAEDYDVVENSKLAKLPEESQMVIKNIISYVNNTKFKHLGAIGLALLFYSVIKAMGTVEKSFNEIWCVSEERSWHRKFSDYISVIISVPVLILLATAANTALTSEALTMKMQNISGHLFWLYDHFIKLSVLIFIIIAFTMLYIFMPNKKVKFFPALAGGILGGVSWMITQRLYLEGQVGLTKLNATYGAFAAVPFFLIWLKTSWTLVLFGSELGFAIQNQATFKIESAASTSGNGAFRMLGLIFIYETCKSFNNGKNIWNPVPYCSQKKIPAKLMNKVLDKLITAKVLRQVNTGDIEGYVPGTAINKLSPADWENAFLDIEDTCYISIKENAPEKVKELYNDIYENMHDKLSHINFSDLLIENEAGSPDVGKASC